MSTTISLNIPASIQLGVAVGAQGNVPQTSVNGSNPFLVNLRANLSTSGAAFGGGSSAGAGGAATATATSPGAFSLPGIDTSSWDNALSQISQIGSSLDSMQSEAMKLMSSKNPSDQMKGQMMLQQFQQIMSAIIKAIQIAGDMAKDAINSSKAG